MLRRVFATEGTENTERRKEIAAGVKVDHAPGAKPTAFSSYSESSAISVANLLVSSL